MFGLIECGSHVLTTPAGPASPQGLKRSLLSALPVHAKAALPTASGDRVYPHASDRDRVLTPLNAGRRSKLRAYRRTSDRAVFLDGSGPHLPARLNLCLPGLGTEHTNIHFTRDGQAWPPANSMACFARVLLNCDWDQACQAKLPLSITYQRRELPAHPPVDLHFQERAYQDQCFTGAPNPLPIRPFVGTARCWRLDGAWDSGRVLTRTSVRALAVRQHMTVGAVAITGFDARMALGR